MGFGGSKDSKDSIINVSSTYTYSSTGEFRISERLHNAMSSARGVAVLVAGAGGVGKTALCRRITDDEFREDYTATMCLDWLTVNINVENKAVKFRLMCAACLPAPYL